MVVLQEMPFIIYECPEIDTIRGTIYSVVKKNRFCSIFYNFGQTLENKNCYIRSQCNAIEHLRVSYKSVMWKLFFFYGRQLFSTRIFNNYYTICAKLGGIYMDRILLTIQGFCKNNDREQRTFH
jgi:hypothetical protein